MNLRTLIALLLMLMLSLSASGFQQSQTEETTAADVNDRKLTPDEEREARELAARFIKRWEETEDLSPLIDEFFVHDFAERLHYEPQHLYFGEIKDEKSILQSSADLQRHYVAMTNFLRLLIRLQEIYEPILKSEEGQSEMDLKHLLPPAIWDVLRSNPVMKAVMSEELGEQAEGQTEGSGQGTEERVNPRVIKNLEELRQLTATMEQAVTLLRAHLKTLPRTISTSEAIINQQNNTQSSGSEDDDPLMLRAHFISEEFYGYPKGTRVICLNIMLFHVDLVRINDRLKVLGLYMQTD